MQVQLVDVICDTNFLIHLATRRITNIDDLGVDIGQITFVVPLVVIEELVKLQDNPSKKQDILLTLQYIKNFKTVDISGTFADKELIKHASSRRCIIGTMDKKLKKQIKSHGSSIMSFSKNKIVLES